MTLPQSEPVISVVLPVYNCQDYIREAVESVLRQTFDDFELILIDDGSTDDTPLILRQFTDARIHLITKQNQGLAATLIAELGSPAESISPARIRMISHCPSAS